MPRINFTVKTLAALPLPDTDRIEYWDKSMRSFGLRISSTGQRSWVVMYVVASTKKVKRYTIGDYGIIPLAEARQTAKEILYEASKGKDPGVKKANLRAAETFNEVANAYIEGWAKGPGGDANPRKRSWKQDEKLLKWYVRPHWGDRKANQIKRADVKALLNYHANRGAPIVANRLRALISKLFNFALEEELGFLEYNPCYNVRRPAPENPGQRVLSFEEIRKLWRALEASPDKEAAAIIKLRLFTLQRGTELRLMQWSEIDLESGWWTIPGSRTKNKLDHRVPITEQVWEVIRKFESNRKSSPFVFASPIKLEHAIVNVKDPFARIREASGVEHLFTMRDLRRTGTSHMTGQLGIHRSMVGKLLNHVEAGVTKVYDRHAYDLEKREALGAWNVLLERILDGFNNNTVLLMTRTNRAMA